MTNRALVHLPCVLGALALSLGLAVGPEVGRAVEPSSAAVVEATQIRPGVAVLTTSKGGNVGVCHGPEGVMLIDDQLVRITPAVLEAVGRLSSEPIRLVANTHWHADHTGGNAAVAGTGAIVVAHDNVRKRMSSEQINGITGRKTPASPPEALPVVTFERDVTLHLNGNTIRVEHVAPAHTDGDSIVYFEEADVIHMGDVYFNGIYPYIDLGSGGDPKGVLAAVDRVLARAGEGTRIIPGHGPLSDARELRAYRAMLAGVIEGVERGIAEGKSLEEVVGAGVTGDWDEEWGDGFLSAEVFVGILYRGLKGE